VEAHIALLPGDGIGPEVVSAAVEVLSAVGKAFGHRFATETRLIGGAALDAAGTPLPDETLTACRAADAVLLGAVGGPQWDDPAAAVRPEQGLLGLRKALSLFANLRPVRPHPDLAGASPIRRDLLDEVDLVVVRELTGGIYFGEPRERCVRDGETHAVDTMRYSESEIRRVARLAFETARGRRCKVTSVDKANVLETSRLWRTTVQTAAADFPEVALEHLLVDAAAMHLLTRPRDFDVIVTENLFGDILTDEASVLSGSLGNMPSASLGEGRNRFGLPRGLYEPIHGSAPNIAGRGVANPIGTILSAAMLLRHSLGLASEAGAVEAAVEHALSAGARTADLVVPGEPSLTTAGMADAVIDLIQ